MFWVVRKTPVGSAVKGVYIHTLMAIIFLSGLYTNYNGFPFVIGPFLLDLAIPAGPSLGSTIVNKFNCFTKSSASTIL